MNEIRIASALALQYELVSCLGREVELLPMLRRFCTSLLKQTGSTAIYIWTHEPQSDNENCYTYPGRARDEADNIRAQLRDIQAPRGWREIGLADGRFLY